MRPLVAAGIVAAVLAGTAVASTRPRVTASIPSVARVGTVLRVTGRAPREALAELEERLSPGGRWTVVARSRVHAGSFALVWTPPAGGPIVMLRVVAVRRGRTLAASSVQTVLIGAAPVLCAAPQTVAPPAGEGLIVGGVYNAGGPAPGITVCRGQANTVAVTDAAGTVVATQGVPAGVSYVFHVRPGAYTLSSGYCRGTASVSAGATTHADTVCAVP